MGTLADAFRQHFSAACGDGEGNHNKCLHYGGGQHTIAGADQLPPKPVLYRVPKILWHRSSSICLGAVNPCIFSNYTTLPFLVKPYFKEQGREHPGMIQTGHCRTALASRHLLPKGLVKPGKLPNMLTGACGYPKLPST